MKIFFCGKVAKKPSFFVPTKRKEYFYCWFSPYYLLFIFVFCLFSFGVFLFGFLGCVYTFFPLLFLLFFTLSNPIKCLRKRDCKREGEIGRNAHRQSVWEQKWKLLITFLGKGILRVKKRKSLLKSRLFNKSPKRLYFYYSQDVLSA